MKYRKKLAVLSLWVPVIYIFFTWFAWKDRLPEYLPSHWGVSGPADSVMHGESLWLWIAVISTATAIVSSVLLFKNFGGRWTSRAIGAVAGFIVGEAIAIWTVSSATAIDVVDPYTVSLGAYGVLLYISPLYGLIPLALLPLGDAPPVKIKETNSFQADAQYDEAQHNDAQHNDSQRENALQENKVRGVSGVYSEKLTSKLFLVLTVVMAVIAIVMFVLPLFPFMRPWDVEASVTFIFSAVVMLLVVVSVALFCAFTVTVDETGFSIRSWLFNFPVKRISHQDIAEVSATNLQPGQWGGWGYRIMAGRSAIILRSGSGLVITLKNNKQFAVTLDDPSKMATALKRFEAR